MSRMLEERAEQRTRNGGRGKGRRRIKCLGVRKKVHTKAFACKPDRVRKKGTDEAPSADSIAGSWGTDNNILEKGGEEAWR